MAMYPFFHEPTFWKDVDQVYNGSQDPFQNFAVRMVLAITLQRMETKWAGLADSFYLAALGYLEDAIKPMNVKTIQCFCLVAAYSLLTPTRTAVYYVIGLATRLLQALGLCEEKTIVQGANGQPANFLEIDMRRRLFWTVMTMEFGLAHSMGRASAFATSLDHIDVKWYAVVDDQYITPEGIQPGAPRSLKKWISIHFFKMRLLQLEIRRKLYQKKRPEPKDENDPWFKQMEEKLERWRDEIPDTDAGSGIDKAW
jgi:Fungal specific transcription factor domain